MKNKEYYIVVIEAPDGTHVDHLGPWGHEAGADAYIKNQLEPKLPDNKFHIIQLTTPLDFAMSLERAQRFVSQPGEMRRVQ